MRSQKWKVISLKNPKLRLIRTSLRVILSKSIDKEITRLGYLRDLYREKRLDGKLVPSQERRENELINKSSDLLQALTRSILNCGGDATCISFEKNKLSPDIATLGEDMVWNPVLKRWNCINCYNYKYKTKAQKEILLDIVRQGEEEQRSFDVWFSKQIKKD